MNDKVLMEEAQYRRQLIARHGKTVEELEYEEKNRREIKNKYPSKEKIRKVG